MKLELEITRDERNQIAKKAKKFGFDISEYGRFIVAQEIKEMTPKMIRRAKRAVHEDRTGNMRTIASFAELLS